MKALGTGHSQGVLWRDVRGRAARRAAATAVAWWRRQRFEAMGGRSSLLTITHTDALAMAQVMILGG